MTAVSAHVESTSVLADPWRRGHTSGQGRVSDEGARVLPLIPPVQRSSITPGCDAGRTPTERASHQIADSSLVGRLADATSRLARRNEALEGFVALVAHEIKRPLEMALLTDDPRHGIVTALDLVESLLEAARESPDGAWASVHECLTEVAPGFDSIELTVAVNARMQFPLARRSLSVVIRNLLANAAAARAHHVDIRMLHRRGLWWLIVDDDGVGLGDSAGYERGSGLGLELCRRIVGRDGGRLELVPRRAGGTRAILAMDRAA